MTLDAFVKEKKAPLQTVSIPFDSLKEPVGLLKKVHPDSSKLNPKYIPNFFEKELIGETFIHNNFLDKNTILDHQTIGLNRKNYKETNEETSVMTDGEHKQNDESVDHQNIKNLEEKIDQWLKKINSIDQQVHELQFGLSHYCKVIIQSIIERFYQGLDLDIQVQKMTQLVEMVCAKLVVPLHINVYVCSQLLPLLEERIKKSGDFSNFDISIHSIDDSLQCRIEWGESSLVWNVNDFLQQINPLLDEYWPSVIKQSHN
jgi:hypothetical protein